MLFFYLDNDAARAALCKGYGGTRLGQSIVQHVMEDESRLRLKSWYARVPSHSNISDGPSRMDCTEVLTVGIDGSEGRLGLHPREPSLMCAFRMGRARAQRRFPNCLEKGVLRLFVE